MGDGLVTIKSHQISVITGKKLHASGCTTIGTGAVRLTETPDVLFKPLTVGKSYLIQLAKDCKKTYHKHGHIGWKSEWRCMAGGAYFGG